MMRRSPLGGAPKRILLSPCKSFQSANRAIFFNRAPKSGYNLGETHGPGKKKIPKRPTFMAVSFSKSRNSLPRSPRVPNLVLSRLRSQYIGLVVGAIAVVSRKRFFFLLLRSSGKKRKSFFFFFFSLCPENPLVHGRIP